MGVWVKEDRRVAAALPRASLARVTLPGGAFALSLESNYDIAVLIEHTCAFAFRHGSVLLQVGSRRWAVSGRGLRRQRSCAQCNALLGSIAYGSGTRAFCPDCVKRQLTSPPSRGGKAVRTDLPIPVGPPGPAPRGWVRRSR